MTLVLDWSFVRHIIGFNRLFQEGFDQLQGGLSRRSLKRLAIPRKSFFASLVSYHMYMRVNTGQITLGTIHLLRQKKDWVGELKNLQLLLTFSMYCIYAKDIYADIVGGSKKVKNMPT